MPLLSDLTRLVAQDAGQLKMSAATRGRFLDAIPFFETAAEDDPFLAALLAGIAWTESDFTRSAVNAQSGASGMMQIMPFHFERFGWTGANDDGWKCRTENVNAGLRILRDSGLGRLPTREILRRYGGFVSQDPAPYVDRVTTRAMFLLPDFLFR